MKLMLCKMNRVPLCISQLLCFASRIVLRAGAPQHAGMVLGRWLIIAVDGQLGMPAVKPLKYLGEFILG